MSLNSVQRLLHRRFAGQQTPTDRSLATVLSSTRQQLARLGENAQPSPLFREQCLLRLATISSQLEELLQGRLVFHSTETWRTVYEAVLNSCSTRRYLSVAIISSDDYWRDRPGESSLDFNYRLIENGFLIQRVFIIDEYYWPPAARLPSRELLHWIMVQFQRGVEVRLVRLGELENENHLVVDMGIYGRESVGTQQTDIQGRTTRFELSFHPEQVRLAEERWDQLRLYTIGVEKLLG